jgi:hypothetical protein
MKKEEVLRAVEDRIRAEPGIVDMQFLDDKLESEIVKLETRAEKNKACGGLMPFVNTGVWASLDRDVTLFIIILSSELNLNDISGILYIVDQRGQKVGEYVNPDRIEQVKKEKPDALFLSDDFCLYRDVKIQGEPYFDIAPVPFPIIEKIPGVKDVTSGSVSTMSDELIRERTGYKKKGLWSRLVGFNFTDEVER